MTIKDIARLSGYSVATVSRVINHSSYVTRKTYNDVMAVINEHNFVPNINAKQLKQTAGSHIALIVKGSSNMIFAKILESVQGGADALKIGTTIYYIDEDANEVELALQILREQKPLGIMFFGGNLAFFKGDFGKIQIPSILLTTAASDLNFPNLSSVYTDDVLGAASAVDYLFSKGHREIGVLGGNLDNSYISQLRYLGCVKSFTSNSLAFNLEKNFQRSRFSFQSAYDNMKKLYEKNPQITAVFAMSDVMAIGAIRAIVDMGFQVPNDLSVVGYDGIDLGRFYNPMLTTIGQDLEKIAQRSIAILAGQLESSPAPVHESIPFELIIGESVR